jgi:glycosyltransferase involved in cell wall biosynthesis
VVHAHYLTSYGFVAAAAGIHPLIVTAWGSDVLFDPAERRGAAWLGRVALRRADIVTTVAEHMNASALRFAGRPLEIVSIPFGVDADLFAFAPGAYDGGALRIVCTRNFRPLYDVASVVRATAAVSDGHTHRPTLTLVGDGPERASLESLARDLGIADRVRFCGHVSPSQLAAELAAANVFVTPSHSDGNNVSLNEAMAVGCFPIAADIPANRQWIENGRNGLLFPAGDVSTLSAAIRRAWDDPDLRARSAQLNREIVEQRASWNNCVDATVVLYRTLEHRTTRS